MGEKVHFWHGLQMPRSQRHVCSGRGRTVQNNDCYPTLWRQSHEIPVISVYSRINPAFSRLFPELIAVVWWLSGVVVVLP